MPTTDVLWGDQAADEISADASVVWALIGDVTRMGEWSPVCRRCEWLDAASGPAVGARFMGHNRQQGARWSRECVITTCDEGRELAFHTLFRGQPSTRWRYVLEPIAGGTRVVESYEVLALPRWVRALRRIPGMSTRSWKMTHAGMERTLRGLKAAAEKETP